MDIDDEWRGFVRRSDPDIKYLALMIAVGHVRMSWFGFGRLSCFSFRLTSSVEHIPFFQTQFTIFVGVRLRKTFESFGECLGLVVGLCEGGMPKQ